MRLVDRVAYINHDIDDAVRAGVLDEARAAARADRGARRRRARRASTRSCTTSSSSPTRAGDIVQGAEAGARDGRAARRSCSSTSTSAPAARARAREDRARRRARCSTTTPSDPALLPDGGGAPGADLAQRVTDYLAGMTDRYCIRALRGADACRARSRSRVGAAMARYTDDSKERVRDAVDMVDLVGARIELRRAGRQPYIGLCPFHDERTPSFGDRPGREVYHCFGCQAWRRRVPFVQETEGLDFKGALESLADRYGVELEVEDEDPRGGRAPPAARAAARAARAHRRVLRALAVGVRRGRAAPRVPARRAGWRRRRCASSASATRRAPGTRVLLRRARPASATTSCYDAGLAQRATRGGGRDLRPLPRGGSCSRSPTRAGACSASARARCGDDQQPKYLNTPEGEVFHKGRQLFGADLARAHAAKARRGRSLAEGYTDVIALHQAGLRNAVGDHGHVADRGAGRRAGAPGAGRAARARRRQRRAGGDAARRAGRGGAQARAARRAAAAGLDPADLVVRAGEKPPPPRGCAPRSRPRRGRGRR